MTEQRAITPRLDNPQTLSQATDWDILKWMKEPLDVNPEEWKRVTEHVFADELGEILPWNGVVYLSGHHVHKLFMDVYGPDRAKLVPRNRAWLDTKNAQGNIYLGERILCIDGQYAADGIGDMKAYGETTMADAAAGAETNAWYRVGRAIIKDLIRWHFPAFQREWRVKNAVAVYVQGKKEQCHWRRKDAPVLADEVIPTKHAYPPCPCAACGKRTEATKADPNVKAPQRKVIDTTGATVRTGAGIITSVAGPNKRNIYEVRLDVDSYFTDDTLVAKQANAEKGKPAKVEYIEGEQGIRKIVRLEV